MSDLKTFRDTFSSGTNIQKGDGIGGFVDATAGVDYATINQTMYIGTTAFNINRSSAVVDLSGVTIAGVTLTSQATGFSIDGGTSSKSLTVSNSVAIAGTDGSTLNIGTGGTLGTAAYTSSTSYLLATLKGAVNGLAELDGTGKVPAAQLPSYVDDVLEYANLAAFPGTGTSGIIYIAQDSNKSYRWTGSVYVEVSPSIGTNLTYTTATRAVTSSTGTGFTLPLATTSGPGLLDTFPNNTTTFLRADGTYASPSPGGDVVGTTATQTLSGKTLSNPTITGYVETVVTATGSSFTPDLSTGTLFKYTTNANTVITLPTNVAGKSYTIIVWYGGAHTLLFSGTNLRWADGIVPVGTSVNARADIFTFMCDGTYIFGSLAARNI